MSLQLSSIHACMLRNQHFSRISHLSTSPPTTEFITFPFNALSLIQEGEPAVGSDNGDSLITRNVRSIIHR